MLQAKGEIDDHMMYNTYNMGIGMVMALDPKDVEAAIGAVEAAGEKAFVIGTVENGEKSAELV